MCINVLPNGDGKGKGNYVSDFVSTKMTKDRSTSQRVLKGDTDRAKSGYGRPCCIAHSLLDYNAAKNRQYLKDDCLYFRVKINSDVTLKPWLLSADVF